MKRTHYILDSSSALLGVALIIVTAVHITGNSPAVAADELSFGSAILFLVACLLSHRAISKGNDRFELFADRVFASGLVLLLFAVLTLWF